MINKCNQCGQCCTKTHVGEKAHLLVLNNNSLKGTLKFISENWVFQNKSVMKFGAKFYIYSCKLINPDNTCSIHGSHPYICSGYPWYESEGSNIWDNQPWDYPGCGYELDHYKMRLIRTLHFIIEDQSTTCPCTTE